MKTIILNGNVKSAEERRNVIYLISRIGTLQPVKEMDICEKK